MKPTEKQYIDLVNKYRDLSQQIKIIKTIQDDIKEELGVLLHSEQMNEKIIKLDNEEDWKCGFKTIEKSSTDYKLLMEVVGPIRYKEIVSKNPSTFLEIRKAAKDKTKSIFTTTKPVEDDIEEKIKPIIPDGMILS